MPGHVMDEDELWELREQQDREWDNEIDPDEEEAAWDAAVAAAEDES